MVKPLQRFCAHQRGNGAQKGDGQISEKGKVRNVGNEVKCGALQGEIIILECDVEFLGVDWMET